MGMKPNSILETILYANSLEESAWFYHEVLGFEMAREMSELGIVLRVDPHHVLLIFDPKKSDLPDRAVPSHGARGPGHIAFRIPPNSYDAWIKQFSKHGIAIEQEIEWDRVDPGKSIYVRDPSGNSVELITADIWK